MAAASALLRLIAYHWNVQRACIVFCSRVALFAGIASVSLTGAIRINEIMASNGTILDPDGDHPDWIELYNAGDQPINLTGWGLSDDAKHPFHWVFPDITIDARAYLIVWASDKWAAEDGLHLNFELNADGEDVLLTRGDGEREDWVSATMIPRDVSFGRRPDEPTEWTLFETPTPGGPNNGPHMLRDLVYFSEDSAVFEDPFYLALSADVSGATIHYTMDRSEPDESSPIFRQWPITIDRTTQVRARVIDASGARGPVQTRHYIRAHPNVARMRSNLPIVVMDAHGTKITAHEVTPAGAPRIPGYFFLFDRTAEGVSDLTQKPTLATRQGVRLRGVTSSGWKKAPYSIEFQDDRGFEVSYGVLGMASDSDWVLYPGYWADRLGVRNTVAYELSRAMGRWAPNTRFVEVYMNHNGAILSSADYMGVYALIERIKQGPHRLDIEKLNRWDTPPTGPIDVDAYGPWTGGYYIEGDRFSADTYGWNTRLGFPSFSIFSLKRPKLADLDGGPYLTQAEVDQTSRQMAYIKTYFQAFENSLDEDAANGFSSPRYRRFIDFDSFVDYLILQVFTNNADGLRYSMYFHKPRNRPLVAGPVWDFDRSMGSYDGRDKPWNTWAPVGAVPFWELDWWRYLMSDPDFEQAFYDRWAELRATVFSDAFLVELIKNVGNEINSKAHGLQSAAERNSQRWPEFPLLNQSFQAELEYLIAWAKLRAGWMERRSITGITIPKAPMINVRIDRATDGLFVSVHEQDGEDAGTIYVSFDGTDPRAAGGSPAASPYSIGDEIAVNRSHVVVARVHRDGYWSPIARVDLSDAAHLLPTYSAFYPDNYHAWSLGNGWIYTQTHGYAHVGYHPWVYCVQAAGYADGWIYVSESEIPEMGYYFYSHTESTWFWSSEAYEPYVIAIE